MILLTFISSLVLGLVMMSVIGGTVPYGASGADLGEPAAWRYVEFFTANIRNPNTRRAYARACPVLRLVRGARPDADDDPAARCRHLYRDAPADPFGAGREAAARRGADAVRLADHRPGGADNPAAAVRGPKHVVKTGKTPVLDAKEWRKLLDSIPTETVRDLRDRALIATLTYSFARIGAALKMKVEDLRPKGAGWQLRLHEKGGKHHVMPCHHALAEAFAPTSTPPASPRTARVVCSALARPQRDRAVRTPMAQPDAWRMIRRAPSAAGIHAPIGNHSFRATGITAYLANGGALEHAQEMAAHESPRTTKLYDRTKERLTQDEVERIRL